jgi:large subunit ribosomal protein L10
MPTAKKEQTIEELRKKLGDAKYLFFTNYAGLTVQEITKLRSELRKDGSTYAVVKNTLFSRAAGEELAKQPDDVKGLSVKAAYVDGQILNPAQVTALASILPKAELQARVLGLLASPLRGLVGVLAANPGGFVRVLSAREKQLAESAA